MKFCCVVFAFILPGALCAVLFDVFHRAFPNLTQYPVTGVPGEPVFLTPYIEAKKPEQGREATVVPPLAGNIKSYSGFITVSHKYNSNLFFWYFPSEKGNRSNSPLILWLQGGPGVTSLYGLFEEHGPYIIEPDGNLTLRQHRWTKSFNMLYVDNPVGAGFSFTQNEKGYARSQEDISRDLYQFLTQFFQVFPEVYHAEFYLTGESYAGKYVATLAHEIHVNNPEAMVKINLKGLAVGNGFVDPLNMMVYSDLLYQLGFVDERSKAEIVAFEEKIKAFIRSGRYKEAFFFWTGIFGKISNIGFEYPYDFTDPSTKLDTKMDEFVQQDFIRSRIHVGWFIFQNFEQTYEYLREDMMRSVASLFPELLNNYRILFYNGQLDMVIPYVSTANFLKHLSWDGAANFYQTKRNLWQVDGEVAGYWRETNSLTELLVRNAGHMVPTSQPKWALKMMEQFVEGGFDDNSL